MTPAPERPDEPYEPGFDFKRGRDWFAKDAAAPGTDAGLDVERQRDLREAARAAYLFLNMVHCPDCHLPWPEGYVHDGCTALSRQAEKETA